MRSFTLLATTLVGLVGLAAAAPATSPATPLTAKRAHGQCGYTGIEYPATAKSTCTVGGPYGYGMCGNTPCDFQSEWNTDPCVDYSQFACPQDGAPCWVYNTPPIGSIAHCGWLNEADP